MEDYIFQLRDFLPFEYLDIDNGDYIQYLVNAYLKNVEAGAYQFAFVAFHMLYMSFIYKTIWLLRKEKYENVEFYLNKEAKDIQISSPFDFSIIDEAKIFQILRCLRFHANEIEEFSLPVKNRNHISHASGKIQYSQEAIEQLISKELQYSEKILQKTSLFILGLFKKFINDNWEPETRESITAKASVESFIRQNLLSAKELELLVSFSIDELSNASNSRKYIYIKTLCLILLSVAQRHIDSEENLLLKHLHPLMQEINKQSEVSAEMLINDEFSEILRDFNEEDKITFAQITQHHLPDFLPTNN